MKNFIVYTDLGKIIRTGSCQDQDFLLQAFGNEGVIEGVADPYTQYVVNKQVANLPPKPEGEYVFDYSQSRWVLDTAALIAAAIFQRNALLAKSDWTQIPNGPLTPEEVNAWAVYRQALRDIPQQAGYPVTIIWPTSP